MFLSAIVKAHTDGLDAADVSTLVAANESEQPVARAPANNTRTQKADARAEALAAREARLIELPAIHRARWL
jgi:hypothetical protein